MFLKSYNKLPTLLGISDNVHIVLVFQTICMFGLPSASRSRSSSQRGNLDWTRFLLLVSLWTVFFSRYTTLSRAHSVESLDCRLLQMTVESRPIYSGLLAVDLDSRRLLLSPLQLPDHLFDGRVLDPEENVFGVRFRLLFNSLIVDSLLRLGSCGIGFWKSKQFWLLKPYSAKLQSNLLMTLHSPKLARWLKNETYDSKN